MHKNNYARIFMELLQFHHSTAIGHYYYYQYYCCYYYAAAAFFSHYPLSCLYSLSSAVFSSLHHLLYIHTILEAILSSMFPSDSTPYLPSLLVWTQTELHVPTILSIFFSIFQSVLFHSYTPFNFLTSYSIPMHGSSTCLQKSSQFQWLYFYFSWFIASDHHYCEVILCCPYLYRDENASVCPASYIEACIISQSQHSIVTI